MLYTDMMLKQANNNKYICEIGNSFVFREEFFLSTFHFNVVNFKFRFHDILIVNTHTVFFPSYILLLVVRKATFWCVFDMCVCVCLFFHYSEIYKKWKDMQNERKLSTTGTRNYVGISLESRNGIKIASKSNSNYPP